VDWFHHVLKRDIFHQQKLEQLRPIVLGTRDPLLEVIGIAEDGHLTEGIDSELHGENPR
jgi:hypothetical protein